MTESSERRLRAEQRGKRLRFTRRRRLRRGEKPRSEATSTGQPGRRAEEHAAKRRAPGNRGGERRSSFGAPSCRLAGGHGQRGTGRSHGSTPTAPEEPFGSEASSSDGTGNRVSVNGARTLVRATGQRSRLRERRSVRRQDRVGGAPLPGDRWWRHRLRSRATGTVAKMGIARRAFGHDGRCVGRAKANARRSTSGGSSHLREAPGGCAGASRPHRPGRLTFSA